MAAKQTKYRYKGERTTVITSIPPGVTFQVKPGEVVTLTSGGFEYLADNPAFEEVGSKVESEAEQDEKSEKSKSKK